ncbi:uncharacterized protein BO72DRAFT_446865 [Aspergillus fijiensis CBS 313.89]|uniref:Uncharacterized protein n=1 Tax=Aspergillus fijiensis CBS 313.89 TaxID=1448319 RepID=A0A8G1RXK3_9EURO|nr:uncharacterized protein BO72DRAFT_446865 [Aspergillus fijiensis CBS 313.89]RAK78651.1 hypothetical protein BO72DRAFT_446865 [Aspergillus fijiensis CBS 313.89]
MSLNRLYHASYWLGVTSGDFIDFPKDAIAFEEISVGILEYINHIYRTLYESQPRDT